MPTRIRDLTDTDLATLNSTKNKNVLRYNASTNSFDVIQIDSLLSLSTNPPTSFVSVVENQIDVNNIGFTGVDGGLF